MAYSIRGFLVKVLEEALFFTEGFICLDACEPNRCKSAVSLS